MKGSSAHPCRTAAVAALTLSVMAPLLAAPPRPARRPRAAAPPAVTTKPRQEGFVEMLPVAPRAAAELARLETLAGQKAWDDWAAAYQKLVEDRTLLLPRDQRLLVGLRAHCQELFAAAPAAAQQRYRALYEPEAGRSLRAAASSGEPAQVAEVAGRYRFTTAGRQALRWLADHSLDHGQWAAARLAYRRLAALPDVTEGELLRHAIAAERAGSPAEAARALDRVRQEFGASRMRIAGEATAGTGAAALLRQWLQAPGGRQESPPSATAPALPPGRLEKLWEFRFPSRPSEQGSSSYYEWGRSSRWVTTAGFTFLSYPASAGARIAVQSPRGLLLLDGRTGRPVWQREGFVLPDDEEIPRYVNRRRRDDGPSVYAGGRPFQGSPSLEGALVAARVPMVPKDDAELWPGKPGMGVYRLLDGEPLWQATPGKQPYDTYFNTPLLRGGILYTGATAYRAGITEYQAVALCAATGEAQWRTFLGGASHHIGAVDGSPAAADDERVWLETTLHTLVALDLLTGEPQLVYRAPLQSMGYSSRVVTNRNLTTVAGRDGGVVFSPRWGAEVVALDPARRRITWTGRQADDRGRPSQGILFGADGRRAYLAGRLLQALDLSDGREAWRWQPPGDALGRPALAGERIYVPVEGKIHVLSTTDGSLLEVLPTAEILGGPRVFPSLSVLDGKLLAATADRLVAFGVR